MKPAVGDINDNLYHIGIMDIYVYCLYYVYNSKAYLWGLYEPV